MNEIHIEILKQLSYYLIVMGLMLFVITMIQRGFFWKFFKVKISFGKLVLIKIREINQDQFEVGSIEEGFLKFKRKGEQKLISLSKAKEEPIFYRIMGVNTVDIDGEKYAIQTTGYKAISGYDAGKISNVIMRALFRPNHADLKEKLLIVTLIVLILGVIIILYMVYLQGQKIDVAIQGINQARQGFVVGGGLM